MTESSESASVRRRPPMQRFAGAVLVTVLLNARPRPEPGRSEFLTLPTAAASSQVRRARASEGPAAAAMPVPRPGEPPATMISRPGRVYSLFKLGQLPWAASGRDGSSPGGATLPWETKESPLYRFSGSSLLAEESLSAQQRGHLRVGGQI